MPVVGADGGAPVVEEGGAPWPPGRVAPVVYGVVSTVLLSVAVGEWFAIRLSLVAVAGRLVSEDLFDALLAMHLARTVLLVILPAGAALSHEALPVQVGARGVALRRTTVVAALVWAVGAALTSWGWAGGDDVGWFAYAPNSGVVLFAAGGAGSFVRGPLLMSVGLLLSAACLLLTTLRAGRRRSPRAWPRAVWPQVALQVLVIACLVPSAIDLVRLWLTGEGRIWWL